MKTIILALLAVLLWAAVIDGGIRQWEADQDASAATGACLAAGNAVADCGGAP